MRTFESYVDEVKEKLNIKSDYKLANWLDMPRQSMTKVRNQMILGEDKCVRIARALKRDPLEIIATAKAQNETNPDLKAIWIKLAKEKGNRDE